MEISATKFRVIINFHAFFSCFNIYLYLMVNTVQVSQFIIMHSKVKFIFTRMSNECERIKKGFFVKKFAYLLLILLDG